MGQQVDYAKLAAQHGGKAAGPASGAPVDERKFQQWYAGMAKQYGLNPDPDSPDQRYDYRAAFRAGAKPDASRHWPSQFKKPGHPNEIVGGFSTITGERVPGTTRTKDAAELVSLGWEPATAEKLAKTPEPGPIDYAALAKDNGAIEAPPGRGVVGSAVDTAKDLAVGAAKGVGNTVFGLGKIVHDYTPVGRISDAIQPGAFDERPDILKPANTTQAVGMGLEQVGEFFVPTGAPAKIAKLAEIAKSMGLTLAQTGSPVQAGVAAGVTAAIPGGKAAQRLSGALEDSAEKSVTQALGATKEAMKDTAAKVAPEMIQRGVRGSRAAMLERASGELKAVGSKIEAEIQAAMQAGQTVSGQSVLGVLAKAKGGLMVPDATGALRAIEGTQLVMKRLEKLEEFVTSLGPDIPFDKAAKIKTVWDRIVSKAGLYGQKAGASATDSADAWAIREAAGGFRELLAKGSPTLDDLNKEYAFWKGVKTVLKETQRRTQAQGGGLTAGITGAVGAGSGFASGDSVGDKFEKALVGGVMGRQVVRLVQSPAFRTQVSAPLKQALADALASADKSRVYATVSRIVSSLPAQMRPSFAQ